MRHMIPWYVIYGAIPLVIWLLYQMLMNHRVSRYIRQDNIRHQISYQSIYGSYSLLKSLTLHSVVKQNEYLLSMAKALLNTGFAYSSSSYVSYDEFVHNLRLLLFQQASADGLLVDCNLTPGYRMGKIDLDNQSKLLRMVAIIGAFVTPHHVLHIDMYDQSSDIKLSIQHADLQSAQFDLLQLSRYQSDQLSISYQSDIIQLSYIPE